MSTLVDSIEFRARSPRQALPGLDAARQGLRAIRTELDAINGRLSGLTTMSLFKRSKAELQSLLKENLNISQKLPVRKVAEVLGVPDIKDFQAFVQRWKATHKELSRSTVTGSPGNMVFASGAKAAEIARKYFTSAASRAEEQVKGLNSLLSGVGGGARGGKITAEIAGDIPLIIPANRIIATVGPGTISVQGAASPQSTGQSPKSGGGGSFGGGGPVNTANGPMISESVTTRPGKQPLVRRTYLQAFGKELEIAEQAGAEIGRKATTDVAKQQAEKFRGQLASIKQILQQELALPQQQRDYGRIAALRRDAADTARSLIAGQKGKDLKAMGLGSTVSQIESFAGMQAGRSGADEQRAMVANAQKVFQIRKELAAAREKGDREEAARLNAERRQMEKRIASQNRMLSAGQKSDEKKAAAQAKLAAYNQAAASGAVRQQVSHATAERVLADFLGQGGTVTRESGRQVVGKNGPSFVRTVVAEREFGGKKQVLTATFNEAGASVEKMVKKLSAAREEIGYLGGDFLRNTAKVTLWAASVGVLYKSLELLQYSMARTLEIGEQFQRLDQVFKKVGGSTQELTSDVMHLAAENGRATDEAMQSALQWARLGLTRAQVNEAVRVSLMAANDANVSAEETTEKLQAVMQTYGLTVGELRGTLSEIVQITNSYNVSTGDMLDGLSRTAAAAKQAGLPLAELMGLLGATVGSTGQSGSNIGNAIKSITLALSNPVLQQKLRDQFRFEPTSGGEEIKNMSQLLADLYVKYQHLNGAQRQSLLFSVAGRTQANRLEALLDNYVKAQTLAINAQLNLNTAEEENKKIKAALATQLRGLTAEWERFVVIQGNNGPVKVMTELATALRNLVSIANMGGGKPLTMIMGLLAAGGIKTVLAGLTLKGSGGFLGRTGERMRESMGAMNNSMIDVYNAAMGGALASSVQTRKPTVASRTLGANIMGISQNLSRYQKGLMHVLNLTGRWQMSNSLLVRSFGTVTRAVGVGLMALRQWVVPLSAIYVGVSAFNAAMERFGLSSEEAEKKLSNFNLKTQQAASAANAYSEAADALRTVQEALKPQEGFAGIRPEDAKQMLGQAAELMYQDEPDLGKREKMTQAMREQLETLRQQGKMQEIQDILEKRRNDYIDERKGKLREEYRELINQESAADAEIRRLKKSLGGSLGFVGAEGKRNRISELEQRKSEISSSKTRNLMDQNNAYEERLQYDVKHQSALEKHRLTMESIAQIFESISTNNPFDKAIVNMASLDARLKSIAIRRDELTKEDANDTASEAEKKAALVPLEMEEAYLKKQRAALGKQELRQSKVLSKFAGTDVRAGYVGSGLTNPNAEGPMEQMLNDTMDKLNNVNARLAEIDQKKKAIGEGIVPGNETRFQSRLEQRMKLQEEERQLQAQRNALEGTLPNYEKQMRFQFGQEQARRDLTPFAFGFDETDKMRRQAGFLKSQLDELQNKPNLTLQERGRQLELETQYYHTILGLRERAATVERDINQLVFERTREMQRSLMEAGPDGLLKKLAAFRTAFGPNGHLRNISQGAMMAMSPEFRKEIAGAQFTGLAMGQRMSGTIFDPQLIELLNERNRARPYSGKQMDWPNGSLDQLQRDISSSIGSIAASMAKELPGLFAPASAVLDSFVDKLADKVMPALDAFAERLDQISGHKTTAPKPSGQFGGTGGAVGNINKAGFSPGIIY